MLEELRLYPRSPAKRTESRNAGGGAGIRRGMATHELSTGFADRHRPGSTGRWGSVHSSPRAQAQQKEEVG